MSPLSPRSLSRAALALVISLLASAGCRADSVDDYDPYEEEGGETAEEALSGSLPVGTELRTTVDVNLRSGPSTANKVLHVIPKGAKVAVQSSDPSNGFYQISHDNTVGWTSGKYLEPTGGGGGTVDPSASTLTTLADVNLRSGPGTSYNVLTVIPMSSQVTVVKPDPVDGFYNVTFKTLTGWSSAKYLGPAGADPGSPGTSLFNGQAWKFRAKTLAVDIAVFVPQAAAQATEVDVLFYSHGLNVCSPVAKDPPLSFVTGAPFNLAQIVDASQRPVVLAVPFMDWEHQAANGMAFNGKQHKLGIPSNLNGVVAEVLAQVGEHGSVGAPALSSLVLAGHSRAYDFLNPLAAASADPQMSSGALAKLSRVYAFDTGYVCSPTSNWSKWMASKPSMHIDMFYKAGTGTESCGQQFANMVPASKGQLSVSVAKESHCAVPSTQLPALLDKLP